MTWLDRAERWVRPIATPRLPLILIGGQVIAFILASADPGRLSPLLLDTGAVLGGEVWRVVTYLFVPAGVIAADDPASMDTLLNGWTLLMFFIWCNFFWFTSSALIAEWGPSRYTVYLLVAWLLGVGGAFLEPDGRGDNAFLFSAVFLAFAWMYPDFTILLMLIIPVKAKWLGLMAVFFCVLLLLAGVSRFEILAMFATFLLFFGGELARKVRGHHKTIARRGEQVRAATEPLHQCVVCRRTDKTSPELEFRYARTADGVKCFCIDHLDQASPTSHQPDPEELDPASERVTPSRHES